MASKGALVHAGRSQTLSAKRESRMDDSNWTVSRACLLISILLLIVGYTVGVTGYPTVLFRSYMGRYPGTPREDTLLNTGCVK